MNIVDIRGKLADNANVRANPLNKKIPLVSLHRCSIAPLFS
jgi:hypothetical protein